MGKLRAFAVSKRGLLDLPIGEPGFLYLLLVEALSYPEEGTG